MKPLSLGEVKEIVKSAKDSKDIQDYLKKFSKLTKEKGSQLSDELKGLKNVKMKGEYIVKIIDFLPKDSEDLNKIFSDISLDKEEIDKILEIVKKY